VLDILLTLRKELVDHFLGRGQRYYNDFSYEEYDSKSGKTSHPRFDLGKLILAYDEEGANFIEAARLHLEHRMEDFTI
jgi:hypothetical protein